MALFKKDMNDELNKLIEKIDDPKIRLPKHWFWWDKKIETFKAIEKIDIQILQDIQKLHSLGKDKPEISEKIIYLAKELQTFLMDMRNKHLDTSKDKEKADFVNGLILQIKSLLLQEKGYLEVSEKITLLQNKVDFLVRFVSIDELREIFNNGFILEHYEWILSDKYQFKDIVGSKLLASTDWANNWQLFGFINEIIRIFKVHKQNARDEILNNMFRSYNPLYQIFRTTRLFYFLNTLYPESLKCLSEIVYENKFDNFIQSIEKKIEKEVNDILNDLHIKNKLSRNFFIDSYVKHSSGNNLAQYFEDEIKRYKKDLQNKDSMMMKYFGNDEILNLIKVYEKAIKNINKDIEGRLHKIRTFFQPYFANKQKEDTYLDMIEIEGRKALNEIKLNSFPKEDIKTLRDFFMYKDFFSRDHKNIQRFISLIQKIYLNLNIKGGRANEFKGQYEFSIFVSDDIPTNTGVRVDWRENKSKIPVKEILSISTVLPSSIRTRKIIEELGEKARGIPVFNDKGVLIYPNI
ncbi:MAG: hypothetical protein KKF46_00315 [Nanoarchaeota archaeon]|nr:hypothetical protein [Nanoarchaeota archaeon]MBU1320777.1 hypothetical protein [Nanoarchaeota archaeon]MBU1598144.1 hypothetical protein [Nanoarchaeota archaeon]MBU2442205.1 hypothetical protein [Nanoarchaeota archaeon]